MSAANTDNTNHLSADQGQSQPEYVLVKRPDASLTVVFEHMYLNERLVDVTLSCSNGQLQAHKLVLAACSPYFDNLFEKIANPFHFPVVVIKDMLIEDLKLLVEFMYRGQLTIHHEKLTDLVKCAENLQITGLSNSETLITNPVDKDDLNNHTVTIHVEGPKIPSPSCHKALVKRTKRSISSSINHHVILSRTYQRSIHHNGDYDQRLTPEKLLEQSMTTACDTIDGGNQLGSSAYAIAAATNSHSNSAKNLSNGHHLSQNISHHYNQLHTNPVSSLQHIQNHLSIDGQHSMNSNQQSSHNLSNQLQVLSHSLASNKASASSHGSSSNGHVGSHLLSTATHQSTSTSSSLARSRVHPCNICWKTFREKANLKRHLQVHSIDRVVYACPDCNKTFSWKDNYIRHTKTAHHMNNVTRQQGT